MKPLHCIVCVKPVPDFGARGAEFDRQTGTVKRENVPAVINPLDKNALEAALRLKESYGGKVTVLAMAPPFTENVLREALAFGADEAVLLSDRAFAGSDTLATSRVLARGVQKIGAFDLILAGSASTDGGTAQVGPQLAELLGIPHVSFVTSLARKEENVLELAAKTEGGAVLLEVTLPALLTVSREINAPRPLALFGIATAAAKPLRVFGAAELGIGPEQAGEAGSPTRVAGFLEVSRARKGEILPATAETAACLAQKFRAWEVL